MLTAQQTADLRVIARFFRVLALRGQVQIPLADWDVVLARIQDAFEVGWIIRGEAGMRALADWLQARYPVRLLALLTSDQVAEG